MGRKCDFVTLYSRAEHPPVNEYHAKLGVTLTEDAAGLLVEFDVDPNPTPEQLRLLVAWLGRPGIIP